MQYTIFQVDAFTDDLFHGNPAAVIPLTTWMTYEKLQNVAFENNLSETAFFVKEDNHYHIRWFTPTVEVDLCGHATLATAYVIFNHYNPGSDNIRFHSRSGFLDVKKEGDLLLMNFPSDVISQVTAPPKLIDAMGVLPKEIWKGKTDYMLVYSTMEDIENLNPDMRILEQVKARGVIVTAKGAGAGCDFVSRFFAPACGVNEDPVTGSAHTTLTNYWSKKLGKTELDAIQLSQRKGFLHCRDLGERVEIAGKAVLYMKGEISL